jgi:endonuclease/exonuclease/phosphatase family metal-dependent hydrolase
MKIYSWNVLRENKKLDDVYRFIEETDFDVLCLQEVTQEMLERIQSMPFSTAYGIDKYLHPTRFFSKLFSKESIELKKGAAKEVNYLVIVSRHEILDRKEIALPEVPHPLISRLFEYAMAVLMKWQSFSHPGALYADSMISGKMVRIFCVHLTLWTPKVRASQFSLIAGHVENDMPAVICGDFNILEFWPVTLLNFLCGGAVWQAMPGYSERSSIEKLFAAQGFRNPLRGKVTHHFSRSQLDHILVSKGIEVTNASVLADSHGSDHQPVCVEASIDSG